MANPRLLKTDGSDKPLQVTSADFDIARHNAVITIDHDGNHRTFMIRTIQEGESFGKPGDRIVSLLTGPDRDDYRNWKTFGFVAPNGNVNVFHKLRGNGKKSHHDWFAIMLSNPARFEVKGYAYLMMAFCTRCNRPLTHPESIRTGLGPICGGRQAKAA